MPLLPCMFQMTDGRKSRPPILANTSIPKPLILHPLMISTCHAIHKQPYGLAVLARAVFQGECLSVYADELSRRLTADPHDAGALLDVAILHMLNGNHAYGIVSQQHAFEICRTYRKMPARVSSEPRRLLVLSIAGELMANMPIDLLLHNTTFVVDTIYLDAGGPLPTNLPDRDVTLVAIAHATSNASTLALLTNWEEVYSRPLVCDPARVLELSRETLWLKLANCAGLRIPPTYGVSRRELESDWHTTSPGFHFPIIVRPIDSHAGIGLEKLDAPASLTRYLASNPADSYYVSPFIDYSDHAGVYCKFRIALIQGAPYACHAAYSRHWMVHYLNANMDNDIGKQQAEELFFFTFDSFRQKHAMAFGEIHSRLALDYIVLDCAEMSTGELLIFEADTGMLVHNLENEQMFPYKAKQMSMVFDAFERMLVRVAEGTPPQLALGGAGDLPVTVTDGSCGPTESL